MKKREEDNATNRNVALGFFPTRIRSKVIRAQSQDNSPVKDSAGGFDVINNVAYVPIADTAEARTIRMHEATHAIYSKEKIRADEYDKQALEDAKVHLVYLRDISGSARRDELATALTDVKYTATKSRQLVKAGAINKLSPESRAIAVTQMLRSAAIMRKGDVKPVAKKLFSEAADNLQINEARLNRVLRLLEQGEEQRALALLGHEMVNPPSKQELEQERKAKAAKDAAKSDKQAQGQKGKGKSDKSSSGKGDKGQGKGEGDNGKGDGRDKSTGDKGDKSSTPSDQDSNAKSDRSNRQSLGDSNETSKGGGVGQGGVSKYDASRAKKAVADGSEEDEEFENATDDSGDEDFDQDQDQDEAANEDFESGDVDQSEESTDQTGDPAESDQTQEDPSERDGEVSQEEPEPVVDEAEQTGKLKPLTSASLNKDVMQQVAKQVMLTPKAARAEGQAIFDAAQLDKDDIGVVVFEKQHIGLGDVDEKNVPKLYIHILNPNVPRKVKGRGTSISTPTTFGMKIRANRLALAAAQPAGNHRLFEKKKSGGTVLIDASGSMGLTDKHLYDIAEMIPAGRIAYYSGRGGYYGLSYEREREVYTKGATNTAELIRAEMNYLDNKASFAGDLVIYADKGKIRRNNGETLPFRGGDNLVDYASMYWLSKQKGPRYFITDMDWTGPLVEQSRQLFKHLVDKNLIIHCKSIDEMKEKILKNRRK